MNKLYLASKSFSRKYLLQEARIPFIVIEQDADETSCDWTLPIDQLVTAIAAAKMEHAVMPAGAEGDVAFVLSADTLCQDSTGMIHGKPINYEDAVDKLRLLRQGSFIYTGFCLDKKVYEQGTWRVIKRHQQVVKSSCLFIVPECDIESYFKEHPIALKAAGALAIEQYGLRYLKSIEGSYTNIIGLPIYEVQALLQAWDFFAAV